MDLSKLEFSSLHMIYEYFRFIDTYMNNFFNEFIEKKNSGLFNKIFEDSINECFTVIERCDLLKKLVQEYLDGNPRDILWEVDNVVSTKKEFKECSDTLRDLLDNNT